MGIWSSGGISLRARGCSERTGYLIVWQDELYIYGVG
jgi:hypothetical protein